MSKRMILRRPDGETYLERWGVECKLFGIYVHKMEAPDPGVHLHDHPWQFASLILWGGYQEERSPIKYGVIRARDAASWESVHPSPAPRGDVSRRRWLSVRGLGYNTCHRITRLRRKTSWSLVFRGPKSKDHWSFYTEQGVVESGRYDDLYPDRVSEVISR